MLEDGKKRKELKSAKRERAKANDETEQGRTGEKNEDYA